MTFVHFMVSKKIGFSIITINIARIRALLRVAFSLHVFLAQDGRNVIHAGNDDCNRDHLGAGGAIV